MLALGSAVFYVVGAWHHPWWVVLLAVEIMLTWVIALFLPCVQAKKTLLSGSLALLFGILLIFKYAGLLGTNLVLPLGVSFYTFQMAAYLMDVTHGKVEPVARLWDYLAEILMFPKLLSGPLMPPSELGSQLTERQYHLEGFDRGLREFIVGLSMKVLLADRVGGLWTQVQTIGFESISTPMAWLGLAGYCFQLYFDFWGYSRMAVGLGRMLGFRLPRNFDHPYAANHFEFAGGLAAHGNLARQHLELSLVGPSDFPPDCAGKAGPGPSSGAAPGGGSCVHAAGCPAELASVCSTRPGSNWDLSHPAVSLLRRWHCGEPGGFPSLRQAVCSVSGGVHTALQPLAGTGLEPDSLFHSGDRGVFPAVLGGGLLHVCCRE